MNGAFSLPPEQNVNIANHFPCAAADAGIRVYPTTAIAAQVHTTNKVISA